MILYNVTVAIDRNVEEEWKKWMRDEHIPEVLETGLFVEHKFMKVLHHDDPDSASYSIQYFAKTMNDFQTYQKEFAQELQRKHIEKFKDQFAAFRTLLQSVE